MKDYSSPFCYINECSELTLCFDVEFEVIMHIKCDKISFIYAKKKLKNSCVIMAKTLDTTYNTAA